MFSTKLPRRIIGFIKFFLILWIGIMGQGYVAAHPQVDILFIMDNSGSMVEEQDHLAENFEIFIREFSSRNIDFNLGVISSDALPTKDADEMGYPHYWSNEGVDAWGNAYVGFHSQGPGTLLSRDARHMFITEEMEISRSIELFKKNIKLGVNGNGAETPLLSLQRALLSTSPSMMRFFRPKSLLSIIFVTDEDESMSPTDARYLRENPIAMRLRQKETQEVLFAKKGDASNILLHSITSDPNDPCSDAFDPFPKTIFEFVQEMGGQTEDICSDFGQSLKIIAMRTLDKLKKRSFELVSDR